MSAFVADMQRWAALMQALAGTPPGSPEFQQTLLSIRENLAAQMEAWLRTSHPFNGGLSGPPVPPPPFSSPGRTNGMLEPDVSGIAGLLYKWLQLQSQFTAHWSVIGRAAVERFATQVGPSAAGGQLTDLRKLYDLWIDCAEEAYAQVAHSDAFARSVSEAINATVGLHTQGERQLQLWARAAGLATREEIDALARRIDEFEQSGRRRSPKPKVSRKRRSKAKRRS